MRKTRIIGWMLTILMVFGLLAACSPAGNQPSAETAASATPTPDNAPASTLPEPADSQPAESQSAVPEDEDDGDESFAHEQDAQFDSLEETLTALLDVYVATGKGHPTDDPVQSDYAAFYLFALANEFYAEQAKEVEELSGGNFDKYVAWDASYVDGLLMRAFGPAFTAADLKETNSLKILNGKYYIGLSDAGPCKVSYDGDSAAEIDNTTEYIFSYTYVPEDDSSPVSGKLTAYLSMDDATGMAYVTAFSVDQDLTA